MNQSKSLLVFSILLVMLPILSAITHLASATAAEFKPVSDSSSSLMMPSEASRVEINQLPPMAPGVLLVGLKPGITIRVSDLDVQASDASLSTAFADIGVRRIRPIFPHAARSLGVAPTDDEMDLSSIYRLDLAPDADVLGIIRDLNANPAVAYAEPDYLAHIIATPNDPLYSGQWGLAQINAPDAWDVVSGTSDVVIAVVDAGLETGHPDLIGQLWENPGEIAGNAEDDDNNGYVDDVHGWNIVDGNADLSDATGHGTQVAGVIAAATNNSEGVAGLCWNCRLMVVKVTQPSGVANYSDIAAGVAYAAQKGAEVINLSLGGSSDSITLKAAIENAAQTAVIVGGAGNDNKSDPLYPAAYDDFVLAVAGTTITDKKVSTSSYGTWVDVSAPGEAITTTFSGGGYGSTSGTSMAAAFVSGLAGLLRSQHPDWSANMVRAQIILTGDNIDSLNPGYEGRLGNGRINASEAVTTAAQPMLVYEGHTVDGLLNGQPEPGTTVDLDVMLFNEGGDATNVQVTLGESDPYVTMVTGTASYDDIGAYESGMNTAPFRFNVSASAPYAHEITFTLHLTAGGGYTATSAFIVKTASGIENVSGVISTDTTWTADKVYHATGNILVSPGVTLTIESGTPVKFEAGKALVIRGTLIADGTPEQQILFTSASTLPAPGDWGGSYMGSSTGGIVFTSESESAHFDLSGNYQSGSIIRYAVIEYSQGGIQTGPAAPFIDHNLFQRNYDIAIGCETCSSQLIISHNRIQNNDAPYVLNLVLGQAEVRQNLIADNAGAVRMVGAQKLISNTITHNEGTWCHSAPGAICLEGSGNPPEMQGNNIYGNLGLYDISMGTGAGATGDVNASGNYWGTTDEAAIQARIYDFNQDMNAGLFTFTPFLTAPEPAAPGFMDDLSMSPASPVGIQTISFKLDFSRAMEQSVNPAVTFGMTTPFTSSVVLDNAEWLNESAWRATYDVTSLVPRGTYTVHVSGVKGTDGMEIPADTRFGFTVDYAGEITDRTPPAPPLVMAAGRKGDASTVEAMWSANDPESSITGYRYAIGSATGAMDIVSWTNINSNSVIRSGLGLVEGRQYWLTVQARNEGGLWSASGYSAFVAGQPFHRVFLPLVTRK